MGLANCPAASAVSAAHDNFATHSAAYAHAATGSSSSFSSLLECQRALRAEVPWNPVRRVVWVRRDVLPRFPGSSMLVRRLLLARSSSIQLDAARSSPTTATARASAVGPAPPTAPGAAPDP